MWFMDGLSDYLLKLSQSTILVNSVWLPNIRSAGEGLKEPDLPPSLVESREPFYGALLAHPAGFEPATLWFEARCAIQLRHGCFVERNIEIEVSQGVDKRIHPYVPKFGTFFQSGVGRLSRFHYIPRFPKPTKEKDL
jgi:hypothetical protein